MTGEGVGPDETLADPCKERVRQAEEALRLAQETQAEAERRLHHAQEGLLQVELRRMRAEEELRSARRDLGAR